MISPSYYKAYVHVQTLFVFILKTATGITSRIFLSLTRTKQFHLPFVVPSFIMNCCIQYRLSVKPRIGLCRVFMDLFYPTQSCGPNVSQVFVIHEFVTCSRHRCAVVSLPLFRDPTVFSNQGDLYSMCLA